MTEHRDDPAAEPLDRPLREALRHAPDAALDAPPALGKAILQRARAALDDGRPTAAPARGGAMATGGAAQHRRSAATPTGLRAALAAAWDWLARPPVAAAMASVLVATTLGLLWRDGLMDDPFADPPSPAPTAAPTAAPTPAPTAAPASPVADTPATTPPTPLAANPPSENTRRAVPEPAPATRELAAPATTTTPAASAREARGLGEPVEGPPVSAETPGPQHDATADRARPGAEATPSPAQKAAPGTAAPTHTPMPAPAAAPSPALRAPAVPPAPPAAIPQPRAPAAATVPAPAPAAEPAPAPAPPPASPAPMAMTPAPVPAAPRPLPPAPTGAMAPGPAAIAGADPAVPTGQATPAALPGDASSPRRAASMARFSAAPAASEGLRSGAAARLETTAVSSHDVELARLAGALRSEPVRWAQRTAGGEARTAADPAAAWIDALRREAAATDARWAAVGPGDAASPDADNAATLTLLRDGQRRHRFVLKDGRVVWESGTGAVRVLPLPPQAMQRLVDRLP